MLTTFLRTIEVAIKHCGHDSEEQTHLPLVEREQTEQQFLSSILLDVISMRLTEPDYHDNIDSLIKELEAKIRNRMTLRNAALNK